ncbi:MAG: YggT family protein [Chloroflexi bacterium]|nr:YggT family protein [Chloroflexota bacterium]
MEYFVRTIDILCYVLIVAIIARSILSWFSLRPDNPLHPILVALDLITQPLLSPLRRVIPRTGMFDITPMVAIFLLYLIGQLIHLMPT